ncbi:MAG TPA: site-specific integrase [Verrucomicrobiae bacterium]|nr:site-specific integrase [Verrucomicrobiae bacterium]
METAGESVLEEIRTIRKMIDPSTRVAAPRLFEEAAEEYLRERVLRARRPRDVKHCESHTRIAVRGLRGKLMHEISLSDLHRHVSERLSRDGVSGPTVNRGMAWVSALFNWAIERGYAAENPVKRLKKSRENVGRTRYLTPEEVGRLVDACRSPHLQALVVAAIHTGGRLGELLALSWKDVDFARRLIQLRAETTKSRKARIVPLNDDLATLLMFMRGGVAKAPEDPVFTFRGWPIQSVRTAFERARRRAGLEDVHFHDLRHTFASHFVQNGGQIYVLQTILGHSSTRMTQRYAHLSESSILEAVKFMRIAQG